MLRKIAKATPLVVVAAAALALTACSGDGGSSETTGPAQTTLTIAQSGSPQMFAPSFAEGSQPYLLSTYDTLTGIDADGTPTPDLAEKWKQSADGLTITFDLAKNATFHDGTPVTSTSVSDAMTWLLDPANAQNLGPRFAAILDKVETPDEHTVVFQLKAPAPGLYYLLSEFLIVNVAKINDTATTDAGSGPFTVTELVPGSSYTMEAYPKYFRDGLPTLKKIVVRTIADPEAQYAALQSGDVDMIYAASDQTALQVQGNDAYKVQKAALGAINPYLMMNTSRPPFDNQLVRQAIAAAVNRDAMVKVAFPGGSAVSNCQPFAPGSPFYLDKFSGKSCTYDLDAAKKLLAKAGYPDGFSTTIGVSTNYGPHGTPDMAQILQSDLAKIGITLTVNTLDGAVQRDNLVNSKFDLILHSYAASNADPTFYVPSRTFGPDNGFSTYTSPELADLIGKASLELDAKKRADDYKKFAELVSDQAYIVPIGSASVLYITKSGVSGVGSDISGWPILAAAKVAG